MTFIFDLDGTLYDKRRLPVRLVTGDLRNLFVLKAERTARKAMEGHFYGSSEALYTALFARIAALSGIPAERAAAWYRERYMPLMVRTLSRHYKARPGVQELFSRLRAAGERVVVLSDYGFVPEKLRALGIDPAWADWVVDSPSLGGFKPCREVFQAVADRYPGPCLVIGDRDDTDGAGARSTGMSFRLITSGADWDAFRHSL